MNFNEAFKRKTKLHLLKYGGIDGTHHTKANRHTLQFLCGHRSYRSYLLQFGHDVSEMYPVRGVGETRSICCAITNGSKHKDLNVIAGEVMRAETILDVIFKCRAL